MDKDITYLPFPVTFLQTAFNDIREVCNDIMDYAIYRKCLDEEGAKHIRIKKSASFYGITLGDYDNTYQNGEQLYRSTPENTPITAINKDILFDYYKNHKTEYEIICLCAFLAIKSIIGPKPYAKVTNKYLLTRMAGYASIKDAPAELPDTILKYSTRKRLNTLKFDLMEAWGVKIYARHTRGWYVSIKTDINSLVLEAEKQRKTYRVKHFKEQEQEAIRQAQMKLFINN
jgi:hypothetical protein